MDEWKVEARIKYLEKRLCERSGHDWGDWHTMLKPEGPKGAVSHRERSCRCCGKGDRMVPPFAVEGGERQ